MSAAGAVTRCAFQKAAHAESVWACAWTEPSPDGGAPLLLTGSLDETVRAWRVDGDAGQLSAVEEWSGDAVSVLGVVAVATGGGLIATSSLDSTVRVWPIAAGAGDPFAFEASPGEAWGLDLAPGAGRLAVAGGASGGVAVWNLETRAQDASLAFPPLVRRAPLFFARLLVSLTRRRMRFQSEDKDRAGAFVLDVAFSPDGRTLAASTCGGRVALFDVETCALVRTLEGLFQPVRCVAWEPSGAVLWAACDDGHLVGWDASSSASGGLVADLDAHGSWALSCDVSPNGSTLASGGADAVVRVWDVRTGLATQTLGGEHTEPVWGVAFSRDGARLASVSDDKSVAVFSVA